MVAVEEVLAPWMSSAWAEVEEVLAQWKSSAWAEVEEVLAPWKSSAWAEVVEPQAARNVAVDQGQQIPATEHVC